MKKQWSAIVALAAIVLASTSSTASAVTWNYSGHVETVYGNGLVFGLGDLVTGTITFNENATTLRAGSSPQNFIYDDALTYMTMGPFLVTNGGVYPDLAVMNIYSNSGVFQDDGFSFGWQADNNATEIFGFAPHAGGSVVTSLAPPVTPFDLSLFPGRIIRRIIDGDGFDARLETLTIAAVPEPSTWAMMLIGFAGVSFAGYRQTVRRRASVAR